MIDQNGNEIFTMTKQEADASVDEMSSMVDYFYGTCEFCGKQRKDCDFDTCKSFDSVR